MWHSLTGYANFKLFTPAALPIPRSLTNICSATCKVGSFLYTLDLLLIFSIVFPPSNFNKSFYVKVCGWGIMLQLYKLLRPGILGTGRNCYDLSSSFLLTVFPRSKMILKTLLTQGELNTHAWRTQAHAISGDHFNQMTYKTMGEKVCTANHRANILKDWKKSKSFWHKKRIKIDSESHQSSFNCMLARLSSKFMPLLTNPQTETPNPLLSNLDSKQANPIF